MTKRPLCFCPAYVFRHKYGRKCKLLETERDYENEHERRMQERDRELDSPTRGQAAEINRQTRERR